MALIPLSRIPNVAQNTPLPLDPASLRPVRVGNGNQRGPDLGGVAQSLMTPTIRQGSFDGAAAGMDALGQGLANLGETGARISAVLQDANMRKTEHHDDAEIARIGGEVEMGLAKYQGTLPERPEGEYVTGWDEQFPKLRESLLKDSTLSEAGRARLDESLGKFNAGARVSLQTASDRLRIEKDTGEILALADRLNEAGQIEEADATLGKLVDRGAIRRDQMQSRQKQWQETRSENAKTTFMQGNPKDFHDDLVDFMKTGKNELLEPLFTGPDKAIQIQRWVEKSGAYLRNVQGEAANSLDDRILKGDVTTPDEIRAETEPLGFTEEDTQSFIDSLAVVRLNTPEGQAEYLSNYDALWSKSVNYDPLADGDGKIRMGILRDIRSQAVEGERKPLLDNLREAIKDGMTPERQRAASLENTIDLLATKNLLLTPPDEKTATEEEKANYVVDLNTKKAALKNSVRKMVKDFPGLDATKDAEWLKSTVGATAADAAAAEFDKIKADRIEMEKPWWANHPGQQVADMLVPTSRIDEDLVESVKGMEGFWEKAQWDSGQHSVGYGTRAKSASEKLSKEEADLRLRAELTSHAKRVDDAARKNGHRLTRSQRAALISFDFNTGAGDRVLTSKDINAVRARMAKYVYADKGDKSPSRGLVNRRNKELQMFDAQ